MRRQHALLRAHLTLVLTLPAMAALTSGACGRHMQAVVQDQEPAAEAKRGPWSSARVIESSGDLLRGPYARGRIGDLIIENESAAFVLQGRRAGGGTAGSIVDAALKEQGARDGLEIFSPLGGGSCPRPSSLETFEVVRAGGDGVGALILARGRYDCAPALAMETAYELLPGTSFLRMTTTLTNEGEAALFDLRLGDEIRWGGTRQWVPGHGFDPQGTHAGVPWIAGLGNRIGYAWASLGREATVDNGAGWSKATLEPTTIDPGESLSFERVFIIGSGDGASLLEASGDLFGGTLGVLTGMFQEVRTNEPLAFGLLEIRDASGRPFSTARAAADGTFRTPLPAGDWVVVSMEPGRVTARAGRARLTAGGRGDASVEATAAGSVEVLVVEQRRDPETPDVLHHFPVPSRLTVHGVDGTVTPSFGPPYDHLGARNVVFLNDGRAKLPLAPGRYRVLASRGIEYETDEGTIDVIPGEKASLELRLRRIVDTRGFLSADLHQHTNLSPGSRVSRSSRVVSNAAEGVDLVIVTDPGEITDLSRTFSRLEPPGELGWLPALEMVGPSGRFGCFPLPLPQADTDLSTIDVQPSAAEFFSACRALGSNAIVQVNHPRDERYGYFTLAGLHPDTGAVDPSLFAGEPVAFDPSFDAIEVMSGAHPGRTEEAMRDWFNLLNLGHRYAGTGGSGADCLIEDMNGYPRTYLGVDARTASELDPSEVARAIRGGRVVVTSGPFPELLARRGATADGGEAGGGGEEVAGIGGTLRVPAGAAVTFSVRVQAPGWADVSGFELIRDGDAAVALELDPDFRQTIRHESDYTLTFEESGWVLLRVRGTIPSTPPGLSPEEGASPPLAFTNPIWIEVVAD